MTAVKPFYARELSEYPVGARRLRLVAVAVLAGLIANFEAEMAPVLPLMLEDLDMSLSTYGLIAAISLIAGAMSAGIGGRLSDTWGRVTVLVPALLFTSFCVYAMVFVQTPRDLLIVRCALSFIEGAAITTTAGLVRDFTPRVGRATAFGFWTWGPVGANFLAAAIAGWTLPIFGSWQSQFVIIGSVALVASLAIAWSIADISPNLRAQVIASVEQIKGHEGEGQVQDWGRARELLRHPHIWAHLVGVTLWLVLYYTFNLYGPTLIQQSFGVTTAQAATVMAYFWVLNLGMLILVGWLSDRFQVRKPVSLVGAVLTTACSVYFIGLMGGNPGIGLLSVAGALLGAFMAIAFVPWMANFSEDAEDVKAILQGTAWGAWGMSVRVMIIVVLLTAPLTVEAAGSWVTWMIIATVCEALFIPAVFLFKGRWRPARRAAGPTALADQPTRRAHDVARGGDTGNRAG
ncbi:MAG: MFS transporter [Streptosporangiales bacterium]|nr:MFS transporter [Streptosporangiales bacterium]